jgi:hypothetical protein
MNHAWRYQKNWQWRIIIWSSLLLIFGKSLGHWFYHALAIDQAYTATTSMANKVGITDILGANQAATTPTQLVIQVRNDTPNEYTLESKVSTGHLDFTGNNFSAAEIKRFTISSENPDLKELGTGDIIFLSAPIPGANNTTCQEVHTLNYDLRYASQIKQPLIINLSSIASRMECKENAPQSSG